MILNKNAELFDIFTRVENIKKIYSLVDIIWIDFFTLDNFDLQNQVALEVSIRKYI